MATVSSACAEDSSTKKRIEISLIARYRIVNIMIDVHITSIIRTLCCVRNNVVTTL